MFVHIVLYSMISQRSSRFPKRGGRLGSFWGRFGVVLGSPEVSCNNVGNLNFSALSLRFSVILCDSLSLLSDENARVYPV